MTSDFLRSHRPVSLVHVTTCPTSQHHQLIQFSLNEWRQTALHINYRAEVRRSSVVWWCLRYLAGDSGLDCAAGKRRHKRNRGGPLNPGGGAVTPEQGNTAALIYLLRCFIRTPLTAAGPFVLLILAIKHACRIGFWVCVSGGFITLNGEYLWRNQIPGHLVQPFITPQYRGQRG